ncbi:hypothetical protein BKP45_08015 [Anaerobacillus alkalidiazotrophicus]|uniref:Uncharacterized protein n=1 Tax=Anaerobacillus alkalidiazotrophicus TaxID=472963 RepID=A0A1S2M823_9BACI|nr:hypothetical protein [Anaerobacillus alkalidiazotrophicus]OIJ20736.1 hypothetical protein BKP45_08015 [Anaerobacillus alkalidiazotrophicus]
MEFVIMIGVVIIVLVCFSIKEKLCLINEQNKAFFKVKNKVNGKVYTVYSVKNESNEGTKFLIFDNNKWQWVLSDIYIPY